MVDYNYETVLVNNLGFASLELHSGKINIGFANFLLVFFPFNFYGFVRDMEHQLNIRRKDDEPRDRKNIVIPTPVPEVSILLSFNELREFVDFLQELEGILIVKEMVRKATSSDNNASLN
ncbi:MAG: hypothetical protein AAF927_09845 [Bacteroidota bacterium]